MQNDTVQNLKYGVDSFQAAAEICELSIIL